MNIPGALFVGALLLAAPAAYAQATGDDFKGEGAALCIAAGELLAAQPGADSSLAGQVLAWRQVLHVVEGTEDQRQAAVASAREAMAGNGGTRAANIAQAAWSAACATREAQIRYIVVHGSEIRTRDNLADEPGAPLDAETVQRLKVNASCIVAADLFLQPRPSRTLRTAFRDADPPLPGPDGLRAIRERARREVDGAPGSAVGRELVVDYLRYLYEGISEGREPQSFINRTSQLLRDHCAAGN